VVDLDSFSLQEWVTNGVAPVTTITTFDGGATFSYPSYDGIDPVSGNVYVASGSGEIDVFNSSGTYLNAFGQAQLASGAMGVAVNPLGTMVYTLAANIDTVFIYSIGGTSANPTYTYKSSFGSSGGPPATLGYSYNLHIDNKGNVWVADSGNFRLAEYTKYGKYLKSFKDPGLQFPFFPSDLFIDGSGNVYATDVYNAFVEEFNSTGTVVCQFGKGILKWPKGITGDGVGKFFVTDATLRQIVVFQ
jgi:streptogramin lyase